MQAAVLIVALFVLACWWAMVRDCYDQERWFVEPYYPRYGATNLEVARWWWRHRRGVAFVLPLIAIALLVLTLPAAARDLDGRHANSPLKPWFDGLKSGRGSCCSDADGWALADVDWESKAGKYRVRVPSKQWLPSKEQPTPPAGIDMIWADVEDAAVITVPNRAVRTMGWPLYGSDGLTIRCFMPGSMT